MKPYLTNADGSPIQMRVGVRFVWNPSTTHLHIQNPDGQPLLFRNGNHQVLFPGGIQALIQMVEVISSMTRLTHEQTWDADQHLVSLELVERNENKSRVD